MGARIETNQTTNNFKFTPRQTTNMEKKRSTTRAPQKEEDPSKTSSSIDTPEVEALQATLKQAKKDQLEQLQETLAITESQLFQSQVALQRSRDKQSETMNLFQQSMAMSPSPNTLKPRQPRPQDLAYKAAIDNQDDRETRGLGQLVIPR
jgi:hypothetical protein